MLSEFHVIRTIRNTKGVAGDIFSFHVNQNFVLSEFVLSGFHCTCIIMCVVLYGYVVICECFTWSTVKAYACLSLMCVRDSTVLYYLYHSPKIIWISKNVYLYDCTKSGRQRYTASLR